MNFTPEEEAKGTWQDWVRKSFGEMDHIFAGHPNDRDRAEVLIRRCVKEGVAMSDVEAEVRSFLKGATPEKVEKELRSVRTLVGSRL